MALVAALTVYLLTFNVLPEIGQDEQQIIVNIAKELSDTKGVRFVYTFKVVGESTALAVVEVFNVARLEKIFSRIYQLGAIETTSTPVISFEEFGRNLGVEELKSLDYTVLQNDNLFYSQVYVDHYGNTTNDFLASFKRWVTGGLIVKRNGNDIGQVFKNVAERKLHIFVNYPDTVSLDNHSFQLPIVKDFGSNIHIQTKGLQFLADYVAANAYSKSVY